MLDHNLPPPQALVPFYCHDHRIINPAALAERLRTASSELVDVRKWMRLVTAGSRSGKGTPIARSGVAKWLESRLANGKPSKHHQRYKELGAVKIRITQLLK
jgi:hypothetical protein